MSAPSTFAVDFILLDPVKLAQTGSREAAIVMQITGLVQGESDDVCTLNAREGSRFTNRNLARLTHFKTHREPIRKAATEAGWSTWYYCSCCGRKFRTNSRCETCGIDFRLTADMESVVGAFPGIPGKVVAYAKQKRHVFTQEPPRA
jgi:hypothetical protein